MTFISEDPVAADEVISTSHQMLCYVLNDDEISEYSCLSRIPVAIPKLKLATVSLTLFLLLRNHQRSLDIFDNLFSTYFDKLIDLPDDILRARLLCVLFYCHHEFTQRFDCPFLSKVFATVLKIATGVNEREAFLAISVLHKMLSDQNYDQKLYTVFKPFSHLIAAVLAESVVGLSIDVVGLLVEKKCIEGAEDFFRIALERLCEVDQ